MVVNNITEAGGFEPTNGGVKVRCLTAWRRPSANIINMIFIIAVCKMMSTIIYNSSTMLSFINLGLIIKNKFIM